MIFFLSVNFAIIAINNNFLVILVSLTVLEITLKFDDLNSQKKFLYCNTFEHKNTKKISLFFLQNLTNHIFSFVLNYEIHAKLNFFA